jgi:Parvulin-like peptidyl-prolyl isomerase
MCYISINKVNEGQPKQTATQFKAQCQQEYAGLRDQVLTFLIQNKWLSGEASGLGVKVSNQEVQKEFERQKKQSFPADAQFKQFLATSGYQVDDLLFQVRGNLYEKKIRAKVTSGKDTVTDQQIAAYYAKNKSRFAQPERRDLLVVLTKTKAKADQAKAALAGGQSFAKVAKRFSIDQASKAQGGKLPSVTPGQQEKAFNTAIFGARKGKLVGPVKTQFGYYVFKVTNVTPASQQTLIQARETIRTQLKSQSQQTALAAFVKKFQKKWKSRTNCRKDFIIASCKNAPKPKAGTQTAPPGAVPQTGGAQQVPQSGGAQQVPQTGSGR